MKTVLSKYPNSENCQEGIPIHPNSSIGTIFHQLLEGARRNQPPNGSDSWTVEHAKSVLKKLTDAENQMLKSSNLNAHLTPLQTKSVYFTRSMKGIFAAVRINSEISAGNRPSNSGIIGSHTLFGAEIRVWDLEENWPYNLGDFEAPNFSIYGQIDGVTQNGNRVVIEDFKTGEIFDENNNINASYILQLRLYAELWILTARYRHGIDDISMSHIDMFIVDESGTRHPVSNYQQDKISNHVRNVMSQTNQKIIDSSNNDELILLLATPNERSCRFCRHRTGCSAYLTELRDNADFSENGFDLIGVIESLPIPNGVGSLDYQFRLRTESDLWLIDSVIQRWIDSNDLQIGQTVGIFGGREVDYEGNLNFDRFFKCSPNQQAVHPNLATQLSELR
jgi:hypothetical protein